MLVYPSHGQWNLQVLVKLKEVLLRMDMKSQIQTFLPRGDLIALGFNDYGQECESNSSSIMINSCSWFSTTIRSCIWLILLQLKDETVCQLYKSCTLSAYSWQCRPHTQTIPGYANRKMAGGGPRLPWFSFLHLSHGLCVALTVGCTQLMPVSYSHLTLPTKA